MTLTRVERLADIYADTLALSNSKSLYLFGPGWRRSTNSDPGGYHHSLSRGNSSPPAVSSHLFLRFQVTGSTNLTFAAEKGFVTLPSIMNSHGRNVRRLSRVSPMHHPRGSAPRQGRETSSSPSTDTRLRNGTKRRASRRHRHWRYSRT